MRLDTLPYDFMDQRTYDSYKCYEIISSKRVNGGDEEIKY